MFNSFGHLFRVTTWGESHGPALGGVVDGCPPGIALAEADIQPWLDARRPGQSRFTTQRQEPDHVEILSGTFEGRTTGAPISLADPQHRPALEGLRRHRAEIPPRARRHHLPPQVRYPRLPRRRPLLGPRDRRPRRRRRRRPRRRSPPSRRPSASAAPWSRSATARSTAPPGTGTRCRETPSGRPDAKAAEGWASYLDGLRKSGNSVGAIIELVAEGVPPGLGAPIYAKLDSDLAMALMTINAVKGVEIGAGFAAAALTGVRERRRDLHGQRRRPRFSSNHAGGILGGISTGQQIVARFAVKPTSSILTPRRTITVTGEETEIVTKGRHDPCVGIRAVPVGEAMLACVLLDHLLLHRGQVGDAGGRIG